MAPSRIRRSDPPFTSFISIPYRHPFDPQSVTMYAIVFPSAEIAGRDTRPVFVICLRSRSDTTLRGFALDRPRAIHNIPPISAMTAIATAVHMNCRRLKVVACSGTAAVKARAKSPAELNRSAGTFARAFSVARSIARGMVSLTTRSFTGFSVSSFAIIACAVAPVTGGSPAIIS